jgi:hypothetical protein
MRLGLLMRNVFRSSADANSRVEEKAGDNRRTGHQVRLRPALVESRFGRCVFA